MRLRFAAAALVFGIAVLSACSGGGSNPPAQQGEAKTQAVALNATTGGLTGSVTYPPATSGSGSPTATLIDPGPNGANAAFATTTVLGSAQLTVNSPETLSESPSFTLTLQGAQVKGLYYFASFYNGSSWQTTFLTGKITGTTVTFASNPNPLTLEPGIVYVFEFYSTTSAAGASPSPVAIPSPAPSHAASPAPSASPSHAASPAPSASPSHAASPAPSASPSHAASPVPSASPSHAAASPSPAPSAATLTGPSTYNGSGGPWGPPAVANAFSFPVQSGYNGFGVTVGIIIDSDVVRSDLSTYLTYFDIPVTSRTVTTETLDGATAGTTTSGQFEATLDTETIAGLAPGANVIIYDMPDLDDSHVNDAVNLAITDGAAKVVSMSLGGCESSYSSSVQAPVFALGASDGITFVASSGDQGNNCYSGSGYQPGVNYPASDPNVTGVGGNESQNSLTNPVAWNDTETGSQEATGGGISAVFSPPPYQVGVSGRASTLVRNVPDIAMPSEYDAININLYGWNGSAYGTSWSAPEMAAMFAELDEYCRANLGAVNALLYAAHASASSDFIDVTSGNNQYEGTGPLYTAAAGYDNTTGFGMPKGMSLAGTICPGRVLAASSRRPGALVETESTRDAVAYTADMRPPVVASVPDLGERNATTAMGIQIVLTPAAARMGQDGPVITALRAAGLTITRTFSNHLLVDASGTTAQIEALFGTSIHQYAQPEYGTRYAPAGAVRIPASLAPYLSGAILDNFVTMRAGPRRGPAHR